MDRIGRIRHFWLIRVSGTGRAWPISDPTLQVDKSEQHGRF